MVRSYISDYPKSSLTYFGISEIKEHNVKLQGISAAHLKLLQHQRLTPSATSKWQAALQSINLPVLMTFRSS